MPYVPVPVLSGGLVGGGGFGAVDGRVSGFDLYGYGLFSTAVNHPCRRAEKGDETGHRALTRRDSESVVFDGRGFFRVEAIGVICVVFRRKFSSADRTCVAGGLETGDAAPVMKTYTFT